MTLRALIRAVLSLPILWTLRLLAVLGAAVLAPLASAAPPGPIVPKIILQAGHHGPVFAAAWTPDGRYVLTVGQDNALFYWDAATGLLIDRVHLGLPTMEDARHYRGGELSMAPDGRFAALSIEMNDNTNRPPSTMIIDVLAHQPVGFVQARPVVWLERGARLLMAKTGCETEPCGLQVVDAATLKPRDLDGGFGDGARVAVSRGGDRFAAVVARAGGTPVLAVWSTADMKPLGAYPLAADEVKDIGFGAGDRKVFAMQKDGALTIVDLASRSIDRRSLGPLLVGSRDIEGVDIDAHTILLKDVVDDPTQNYYCICSVRLLDYQNGRVLARAEGRILQRDPAWGVVLLLESFEDQVGQGTFLDTRTGARFPLGPALAGPVALTSDGKRLFANRQIDLATGVYAQGQWDGPPPTLMVQTIVPAGAPLALSGLHADPAIDASISPNGKRIALLSRVDCVFSDCEGPETVRIWDAAAGAFQPPLTFTGGDDWIHWLDDDTLAADDQNAVATVLLNVSSRTSRRLPIRFARPVTGPGLFVGADPDAYKAHVPAGSDIVVYDEADARIVRRFAPLPPMPFVDGQRGGTDRAERLSLSPDGRTVAASYVAFAGGGARWGRLGLWDFETGVFLGELKGNLAVAQNVRFSADGRQILTGEGEAVRAWDARTGAFLRAFEAHPGGDTDAVASPDDRYVAAFSRLGDGAVRLSDYASAKTLDVLPAAGAVVLRAGFLADSSAVWAQSEDGSVRFWRLTDRAELFTFYPLPDNHWIVSSPSGRYDTNLPADTKVVRWLMPDALTQSLAPQTFMRDYFEPRLATRLLDCTSAGNCGTAFPAPPPLADLNRVLPTVTITAVQSGADGASARVQVEASEGVDPGAANGKTRSGLHDLRLFRDGQLVARFPEPKLEGLEMSEEERYWTWRGDTRVPGGEGGHTVRRSFTIPIPTDAPGKPVVFSAYAFNEDRVKGETSAPVSITPTAVAKPRPRRAYVVAIGVNAYDIPGKSLRFAVNDARALVGALKTIPGYDEIVPVPLLGERGNNHATKEDIHAVLDLLSGQATLADRAHLQAAGVDTDALHAATPDDLVILSFSGHGYADALGSFYLLPSDTQEPDGAIAPTTATMISSAELTTWTRGIDAGEMAMIIDACHSAASVAANGFKPGPMGDPGLGQLAFDKGIRILAATQADDVAMEDEGLGQGLLTYALVHDGLGVAGHPGLAAHDAKGGVRLDALLNYAVDRMPGLAEEVGAKRLVSREVQPMLVPRVPTPPLPAHVQQPSLFDFTGKESPVRLRAGGL